MGIDIAEMSLRVSVYKFSLIPSNLPQNLVNDDNKDSHENVHEHVHDHAHEHAHSGDQRNVGVKCRTASTQVHQPPPQAEHKLPVQGNREMRIRLKLVLEPLSELLAQFQERNRTYMDYTCGENM